MFHSGEENWDFETGDLSCWIAVGEAFKNQPVRGDLIENAWLRSIPLGGDYWSTSIHNGYHGSYWICTAASPLGNAATGTLTSQPFTITRRYLSFLIAGTNDMERVRVELQVRLADVERLYKQTSPPGPPLFLKGTSPSDSSLTRALKRFETLPRDGEFAVLLQATGHDSEIMRQEYWNLSSLLANSQLASIPVSARVKIVDASRTGHISVDHFQFLDAPPDSYHAPVWGFADLHCHPMAHLGFGGKLFWGQPTDPLDHLQSCDGAGHGGGVVSGIVLHKIEAKGTSFAPNRHASCCWPTFKSRTHQQMHVDWIRRAYDGGLRLMCVHAVHNQLLERLMRTQPLTKVCTEEDKSVALRQIEAMYTLAHQHSTWMSIATSATEARQIIAANKLAIVLGVEVDLLGDWRRAEKCSQEEAASLLHMLYAQGVRMLTPLHLTDNAFGGCAIYDDMFNTLNYYYHHAFYEVEDGHTAGVAFRLHPRPARVLFGLLPLRIAQAIKAYQAIPTDHGHINRRGLTEEGYALLYEMMRLGMVIDIDHMSDKAVNETLTYMEQYDYPVVSSHTSFRALIRQHASEVSKTRQQVERIGKLGGMVAPITCQADLHDAAAGKVLNDCAGTVKSWAQSYLYACEVMNGRGVALGTDFNGMVIQSGPRFGEDAASLVEDPLKRKYQRAIQRNGVRYQGRREAPTPYDATPPLRACSTGPCDINIAGLAHYGLLPDFLQDSKNVGLGPRDLAPLFRSAEDFLCMWEKCERKSKII